MGSPASFSFWQADRIIFYCCQEELRDEMFRNFFSPDLNREENLEKKENTINQKASAKRRSISSRFYFFLFREKNVSLVYFFHSRLTISRISPFVFTQGEGRGGRFFLSLSHSTQKVNTALGVIWQKAEANIKKKRICDKAGEMWETE